MYTFHVISLILIIIFSVYVQNLVLNLKFSPIIQVSVCITILVVPLEKFWHVYIYIYREREREGERA